MHKKTHLIILFGGQSAEHEVSVQSAKNVYEAIDKDKYDVSLIGIDKVGKWHVDIEPKLLERVRSIQELPENSVISISQQTGRDLLVSIGDLSAALRDDSEKTVVFPILHGPMGEDGTVQGMLKLLGVPFVGAGVLGSAVGIDKDVMKRLLRDAGIPIAKFVVLRKVGDSVILNSLQYPKVLQTRRGTLKQVQQDIFTYLGLPLFVKPANLGSSVGVSKVTNEKEFSKAVETAFQYDSKILVEEAIVGREIECSVLGNDEPIASVPGEVVPTHAFYDYDAKYIDEHGAKLEIPAKLDDKTTASIQHLAIKTFRTLEGRGLARVDFFVRESGEMLVNEINTMPGFTKISMYPKLWEASGIGYSELIDRLIQLANEIE